MGHGYPPPVAPQYTRQNYRGELEWSFFYLIKKESLPVCVLEIKPYRDLGRRQARIEAYSQVEGHLLNLLEDKHPIPTLYGVSIIGERFLIMTMDTTTGVVTPTLNSGSSLPISKVAPPEYWRNQVLKRSGFRRLHEMVTNIKLMVAHFPPRVMDITYVSDESGESDSSLLKDNSEGTDE
ncbi:hypothetical protein K439DRAFT_1641754 [Ramaria rubella]|nr:hypothetical protein K439DRAFT_1641754 [Ramaria rubella]